jgi:hypothetical protein
VACAGVTALMVVALTTVTPVAAAPPKVTAAARLPPVIVSGAAQRRAAGGRNRHHYGEVGPSPIPDGADWLGRCAGLEDCQQERGSKESDGMTEKPTKGRVGNPSPMTAHVDCFCANAKRYNMFVH